MNEEHAFGLLAEGSSVWAAFDPRDRNPFEPREASDASVKDDVLASFLKADIPETTALLYVLAELTADELESARIHRVLATRDHALPSWLTKLGETTPYRAVEMTHVLGDGDNIMIGVTLPEGFELSFLVYIDHNLGGVVKDAFAVPEPLEDFLRTYKDLLPDEEAQDVSFDDLSLADARARVVDAIEVGAITFPPYESDSWPAGRPLLEWICGLMPEGGRSFERKEWSDEARDELCGRFFHSPFAAGLEHDEGHQDLLSSLLWFACDYGPADPFHWSPVSIEILLTDWLPRKVVAPVDHLDKAPDLIRAFIRFAHAETGVRAGLTEETLAAVDAWESEYREAIRDASRPQGVEALMASMESFMTPPGGEETAQDLAYGRRTRFAEASNRRRGKEAEVPAELHTEVAASVALERLTKLAEFYGDGRKLTQKGNPTLADAAHLVAALETRDRFNETIGDRTFKTKSAAELPELMLHIEWGLASGALRRERGKLRGTARWRNPGKDPAGLWLRAVDSMFGLGPLETFFLHARYREEGEFLDEVTADLLDALAQGDLEWDGALDLVCEIAERDYVWFGWKEDPVQRRTSLGYDLDLWVSILGWAGILEREGAVEQPIGLGLHPRLTGGVLRLKPAGRWWLRNVGFHAEGRE